MCITFLVWSNEIVGLYNFFFKVGEWLSANKSCRARKNLFLLNRFIVLAERTAFQRL